MTRRAISEATREKLRVAASAQAQDQRWRRSLREDAAAPRREDATAPRTRAQEVYDDGRRRRLPAMLQLAISKLVHLEREAARLGYKLEPGELFQMIDAARNGEQMIEAARNGDLIAAERIKKRL